MTYQYLLPVLVLSATLGTIAAFIVLLFKKLGITDWYLTYRRRWMPSGCDFCYAFWVCFILLLLSVFVLGMHLDIVQFISSAAIMPIFTLFLLRR